MIVCILHLGSNKGDKAKYLTKACQKINDDIGQITKRSKIYQTAAWGNTQQNDFLNQALLVKTPLTPFQVLHKIHDIEQILGRTMTEKWGPREIDIDIIFYDHLVLMSKALSIPHPHYANRRFVLAPLLEIAPDFVDPYRELTIAEIAKKSNDTSSVKEYIDA